MADDYLLRRAATLLREDPHASGVCSEPVAGLVADWLNVAASTYIGDDPLLIECAVTLARHIVGRVDG